MYKVDNDMCAIGIGIDTDARNASSETPPLIISMGGYNCLSATVANPQTVRVSLLALTRCPVYML